LRLTYNLRGLVSETPESGNSRDNVMAATTLLADIQGCIRVLQASSALVHSLDNSCCSYVESNAAKTALPFASPQLWQLHLSNECICVCCADGAIIPWQKQHF
jgi:hypothetical protein